jgi:hypothetical protein
LEEVKGEVAYLKDEHVCFYILYWNMPLLYKVEHTLS